MKAIEPNPLFDTYLPQFRKWFAEERSNRIETLILWYSLDAKRKKDGWRLLPDHYQKNFDNAARSCYAVADDERIIIAHKGDLHGWKSSLASCRTFTDMELRLELGDYLERMNAIDAWAIFLFWAVRNRMLEDENGGSRMVLDDRLRPSIKIGGQFVKMDQVTLYADKSPWLGDAAVKSANEFGFFTTFTDLRIGIIDLLERVKFQKQFPGVIGGGDDRPKEQAKSPDTTHRSFDTVAFKKLIDSFATANWKHDPGLNDRVSLVRKGRRGHIDDEAKIGLVGTKAETPHGLPYDIVKLVDRKWCVADNKRIPKKLRLFIESQPSD